MGLQAPFPNFFRNQKMTGFSNQKHVTFSKFFQKSENDGIFKPKTRDFFQIHKGGKGGKSTNHLDTKFPNPKGGYTLVGNGI
jgi:hypothetical protein